MSFLLTNSQLDQKIVEIKRKIHLSMNGVTADHMRDNGVFYKKSFGVAIPRIREIAKDYGKDHDLAQRLWHLNIRETMIMATLIQPADKLQSDAALKWLNGVDNIELAEQTVMNIFSKLPYADGLITESLSSDKIWIQVAGFMLAARNYSNSSENIRIKVLETALQKSNTDEFHLYRSIAVCLGRYCRLGVEMQRRIQDGIKLHFSDKNVAQLYIKEEISQEILFLKE
jgi:3-methyladenine DNA glycosylase AlkD